MRRFIRTMALLCSGTVLAGNAQAGPFWKSPAPTVVPGTYYQNTVPAMMETPPPPLATPVSATVPATGSQSATIPATGSQSATVPATGAHTGSPLPIAGSQPASPTPKNLPSEVGGTIEVPVGGGPVAEQPRYSMVNTRQVLLGYEFKDVGPSGVVGVEVWYTRDGKGWQKFEGVQRENPVWVELDEGTYGIYLLARTGFGGGREAPTDGDQPQMWVQVDLTKPVVFLSGVHPSNGTHTLNLTWTARDDNFGRKPITLSYAEQTGGPWIPIASGLENTGAYTWEIPPSTPSSFYVKVEAADRAGNVESSISPTPVRIDLARPTVVNVQLKSLPNK